MNNSIQRMLERFQDATVKNKRKCFEEYKTIDGKCYGRFGNDKSTNWLALECINCNYHSML